MLSRLKSKPTLLKQQNLTSQSFNRHSEKKIIVVRKKFIFLFTTTHSLNSDNGLDATWRQLRPGSTGGGANRALAPKSAKPQSPPRIWGALGAKLQEIKPYVTS